MISSSQAQTAKAIVNLFETGHVLGDYNSVSLLVGDSGQLSFGRAQTTLSSGGLARLIENYCNTPGALFAPSLSPYLDRLNKKDETLNQDRYLHNLLRASADDPLMRDAQDYFFDQEYWQRALQHAQRSGIQLPLSYAIIYDSLVHGSWPHLRKQVDQDYGTVEARGEQAWLSHYVNHRYAWLANNRQTILRQTTYRMRVFQQLIAADAWVLPLPLVIREQEISVETLTQLPPDVYSGPTVASRLLTVSTPLQRGRDVRLLQLALSALNYNIGADGIYGAQTSAIVREFQQAHQLLVSGNVGEREFESLGLLG